MLGYPQALVIFAVVIVDSIYTPVYNVSYSVENTRVGSIADYDKLTMDIETNGTLTANCSGRGNMRVYVCCASGFEGINGAVGISGQTYLK